MTQHKSSINLEVPLPESAWVGPLLRYRDLVCRNSEVPEAYHWASAVAVIGQLFGRQIHSWYAQKLFLNFFFLLIGGTGTRKSTAINYALDLRAEVPGGDQVIEQPGAASGEGIIKALADAPDGRIIIVEHELAGLIRKAQNQSGGNMLHTLCKVYDAPKRIANGTKNNALSVDMPLGSLICAATPEGLEECLTDAEVYGGLLNRIIPIVGMRRPPQPWPSRPDEAQWLTVGQEIAELVAHYPRQTFVDMVDPIARERWEIFYSSFHADQEGAPEGLVALRHRMHTHVWRLALFFCAMRAGSAIEDEDLCRALEMGRYIDGVVCGQMREVSHGRESMIQGKIERFLSERKLRRKELHQRIGGRVKGSELTKVLRTLLELERVVELDSGELCWADAPYMERFNQRSTAAG